MFRAIWRFILRLFGADLRRWPKMLPPKLTKIQQLGSEAITRTYEFAKHEHRSLTEKEKESIGSWLEILKKSELIFLTPGKDRPFTYEERREANRDIEERFQTYIEMNDYER